MHVEWTEAYHGAKCSRQFTPNNWRLIMVLIHLSPVVYLTICICTVHKKVENSLQTVAHLLSMNCSCLLKKSFSISTDTANNVFFRPIMLPLTWWSLFKGMICPIKNIARANKLIMTAWYAGFHLLVVLKLWRITHKA